jgi:hypothetical protein
VHIHPIVATATVITATASATATVITAVTLFPARGTFAPIRLDRAALLGAIDECVAAVVAEVGEIVRLVTVVAHVVGQVAGHTPARVDVARRVQLSELRAGQRRPRGVRSGPRQTRSRGGARVWISVKY